MESNGPLMINALSPITGCPNTLRWRVLINLKMNRNMSVYGYALPLYMFLEALRPSPIYMLM